ncbi:MAG: hypothetical protein EPO26_05125 [Chloroflexota bacterium]|nr:MAG: hypothetical protein EPO26_05125 [Chloroflexota bacterium]
MTLPLVDRLAAAVGSAADIFVISQDDLPDRVIERYGSSLTVLDDTDLAASRTFDIDVVPTVVHAYPDGNVLTRFVGFDRHAWRDLALDLANVTGTAMPPIDWASLPETRPACGSRSVDIAIEDIGDADLVSRKIDIAPGRDPFETLIDMGVTDGLPVVPPTPERVRAMLTGTVRAPDDIVAVVPPSMGTATVEKVAINAVMAGCRPEYLPVVIAAVEAVCSDDFNIHGVLATTHFVGPILIVNGPVRDRIGMNYGVNALGQGNRANATIGRAVQLLVRNVGGGRPGEIDRATLGQPGKLTFCFAENEGRSSWAPLHVERGFAARQSTVTAFAGVGPVPIADQVSRSAASLARSYGLALAAASHPKQYGLGEIVVIIPPEHVDTFARDGWPKESVRAAIQEATRKPASALRRDDECHEGMLPSDVERVGSATPIEKFRSVRDISIVVSGGDAGKFGAYILGWGGGSRMTTRSIEVMP